MPLRPRLSATALLLVLNAAPALAQTPDPVPPRMEIEVELARGQLLSRVGLYTAVGVAANRAAEIGLDKDLLRRSC
jgi:hypothetical protein